MIHGRLRKKDDLSNAERFFLLEVELLKFNLKVLFFLV